MSFDNFGDLEVYTLNHTLSEEYKQSVWEMYEKIANVHYIDKDYLFQLEPDAFKIIEEAYAYSQVKPDKQGYIPVGGIQFKQGNVFQLNNDNENYYTNILPADDEIVKIFNLQSGRGIELERDAKIKLVNKKVVLEYYKDGNKLKSARRMEVGDKFMTEDGDAFIKTEYCHYSIQYLLVLKPASRYMRLRDCMQFSERDMEEMYNLSKVQPITYDILFEE